MMAGNFKMNWKGPEVERKIARAAITGVNQTMSEAVVHAKLDHGPSAHSRQRWITRSSFLVTSIRPVVAAFERGTKVIGSWGSAGIMYAVFQEIGTTKIPARPFLRPAADAVYPRLTANIRNAFQGRASAGTKAGLGIAGAFRKAFGPIV